MVKKLSDVCEFIVDCEHKTAPLMTSGEYISIRTPNIGKGHFLLNGVNRVSKETYQKWTKRAVPQKNDLIMAREAPAGNVALIRNEKNICLGQRTVLIRPDLKKVNPNYLCCLLLSEFIQAQIEGQSTGATVAHLNMSDIRNLELPDLPDLSNQNEIAAVISCYDEYFSVNDEKIKILQALASECYNEWFVRMRFPGYEDSKFEKGIPKGWKVKKVNEAFEILGGGTPSTEISEYWDGSINWFTPTDITAASGIFLSEAQNKITQTGLSKSSAKLFPAYSIMMTSRATIGAVGINTTPGCTNQGFITCLPNEDIPFTFLYYWISFNKEMFEMFASGSTFLEITKGTFKKLNILVPHQEIVKQFHQICEPIFKEIEILQRQNGYLRELRDKLLPRLISGRLVVRQESKPKKIELLR
jgi:type I restriction enzyme, S subunit